MNQRPAMQESVITASNRTGHPELPALDELFSQADEAGVALAIVKIPAECTAEDPWARQRHDIKGALRTLRLAMDSINSGYRFDDARADAKIDAMEKALKVAEAELGKYLDIIKV